jgi:hypothetical protein
MSATREYVLQIFSTSKKLETAVGLRIKGRNNLLITILEQVTGTETRDTVLIVRPETIYRESLPSSRIFLDEIDQIFNLRIRYHDAFYQYLRTLHTNLRIIREGAGLA